jgi:hypothetical protein
MINIEKVGEDLHAQGIAADTIQKVKSTIIANIPPQTLDKAVLFLGLATIVLAGGSIILAGLGKSVPEALWSALGAGIGGLAGIFMGKK